MAGTVDRFDPSLSRLNRYFDNHSISPNCPPRPPSTTSTITKQNAATVQQLKAGKTSPAPLQSTLPNKSTPSVTSGVKTIDGAACKTSTWTYKHVSAKNNSVTVIEKGARVRPEKRVRKPLQRLNWKEGPWPKAFSAQRDYLDLDTRSSTNLASSDVSPRLAVKRISMLASHKQYKDAADFIHKLPSITVRSALSELPMDSLVESMPLSLPVIEALYCSSGDVTPNMLHVERVVWQMVRFFAQQEECLTGDIRWEFCGPFVVLCRDVLKVVARIQPGLRKNLIHRRRLLEKAIEGMGHHGLVGTSDESLTTLHDALKFEFEKVVKSYTAALTTLHELNTGNKGHVNKGPAPIQASHQRQLSINPHEVQERLIKNKSLLNVVEPTLGNHSLDILLGILQRRIEHDKDSLFQFTQLRKESTDIESDAIVAPILMRYAHGCDQVLDMLREVMEESGYDVTADDDEGSDVSGYHSDSDSAIMMSGNSPYVTKHARFSFLTRSVRDRSRVGSRMSLPMGTNCPSTNSVTSASIRSSGMSLSSSSSDSHSNSTENQSKRASPAPSTSRTDDTVSVLKTPSETASTIPACDSSSEVESLRSELAQARQTIRMMHEREKHLKERLKSVPLTSDFPAPKPLVLPVPDKIRQRAHSQSGKSLVNHSITLHNTNRDQHDTLRTNRDQHDTLRTNRDQHDTLRTNRDQHDMPRSKSVHNLSVESKENWHQKCANECAIDYRTNPPPTLSKKPSLQKIQSHNAAIKNQIFSSHFKQNLERTLSRNEPLPTPPVATSQLVTVTTTTDTKTVNLDQVSSSLVYRYANLYTVSRAETLDALNKIVDLKNASELKSKLLFSVIVLAFRSASTSATALRQDVRRILGVPPSGPEHPKGGHGPESYCKGDDQEKTPKALERAMTSVITANVDSYDLTNNVEDVCHQIWTTLYDYPDLRTCEGLLKYIKECVRVAWGLVNQNPSYAIDYEARVFTAEAHVRLHPSDPTNDIIKTYLWPVLKSENGECVHKGTVIT